MRSRSLAVTAAVVVASALSAFPVTAGASTAPTKPAAAAVNWVIEFTHFTGPGTIRFGGAIIAVGEVGGPKFTTVTLPGGTFHISHHQAGKRSDTVNPKTCVEVYLDHGVSDFSAGTGKYAGIAGHTTYVDHGVYQLAQVNGKCSSTAAPITYNEFALGFGTVSP